MMFSESLINYHVFYVLGGEIKLYMKKTLILIIVVLFAVLKPVYADEVLINIANVDGQVLENYRGIGLNIFSRSKAFSKHLGRVLGSGIVSENSSMIGKKYIYKNSLVERELNEASPDIAGSLPFKAMISGRKDLVAGSAWKKYILNFPSSSNYKEGVFEIKAANVIDSSARVSCVAVKNKRGVFESWRIFDLTDSNVYSENIVLRMNRTFFMQKLWGKDGLNWMMNLLPTNETIAAVVLEQNLQNEINGDSDTVLLFVRPGYGDMGVTNISMVIGWGR